jgi:hypothetical protein
MDQKNQDKLQFKQRGVYMVELSNDPPGYLAAVSDADLGLLYAQHMF